ncbi:MAG: flavin reductase family protein [Rhodospirillaceae bacterium]|nr:flavin reductase family protein [Rhodospirillaceae bacterium]MBT5244575.1 flavin reductase family protein [Rhodospirillaceae bacterium]MBT5563485.1 flavin reductase family protein [Rhodospirillaceae bacterium]MBT6240784.1 flavin reductase family protein [Rhodospirillaceae bacterium]MBT7137790.1 flavin reductase family protein [Rhodospirillaceae bacterium]
MFYDTSTNEHNLPHDPFKACVAPRPIGWISTISAAGITNIAPYSFFNGVASSPPQVMYSTNGTQPHGPKDTLTNIRQGREFVVNVATWDLREAMNITSQPAGPEEDEFALAGLTPEPSQLIKPPRIGQSPINMECTLVDIIDLATNNPDQPNTMVIGQVVGIHIDEAVLTDGMIDNAKLKLLSRLGYKDYACVENVFSMTRPGDGDKLAGL